MRVVIQRVSEARVKIGETVAGEIGRGLLVLLGITHGDTSADGEWLAQKIAKLRVFPDDAGQMNRSVQDIGGGILVVSQFTLIASTRKGTRPSFNDAAKPDTARPLYEAFLGSVEVELGTYVQRGEFGADMKVALLNDGPVTIIIDSRTRE
jgi:D-tyrosyl-tRNA(Tyr) deacylase